MELIVGEDMSSVLHDCPSADCAEAPCFDNIAFKFEGSSRHTLFVKVCMIRKLYLQHNLRDESIHTQERYTSRDAG